MTRPIVVIPCFNEADRLDAGQVRALAEGGTDVWLVDDGSRDRTRAVLEQVAASVGGSAVRALANPGNLGKAETVRRSMAAACEAGAPVVGFLDADFATPAAEYLDLLRVIDEAGAQAVTGARVVLSGRDIRRTEVRHYFGRVFSTIASLALGVPYYDTQCGAKVFRNTPALREALGEPFRSRWAFDVELLGRLLAGNRSVAAVVPSAIVEHPLRVWHDIGGSKLTAAASWRAAADLLMIWRELAARRKR